MRTLISNRIYVYNASWELLQFCREELVISNPTYVTLKRLGKDDQIARRHVPADMALYVENGFDLILPFGSLYAIWKYIKDSPFELKLNDNGIVIDQNMKISIPLFDYQEEAVEKLIAAKGGTLEGSCGCGKTQIGIELAKRIGRNCLWLCHTSDLLTQTVSRIHLLYPNLPVGTITEGEVKMVKNGITVSTIQTLVTIDSDLYKDKFDVVITDECHHVSNSPTLRKMFGTVIEKIPARYKYGLSATLTRADTMIKSMYATVGCNVDGTFSPVWKIEKEKTNTLKANHIRIDLPTEFTYSCLNPDGTFNYLGLIDYLSSNKERNERIVQDSINALEKHQKQIILCQRIEQCEIINNMLQEKGVKSVLLVGKVTKKKREQILVSNKDWNVVVATYSLAKEGLDVPELSLLIYGMITGDKVATIQSAGRVERMCEGKPHPEIYDYLDVNYPYCVGKFKKRVNWLRRR